MRKVACFVYKGKRVAKLEGKEAHTKSHLNAALIVDGFLGPNNRSVQEKAFAVCSAEVFSLFFFQDAVWLVLGNSSHSRSFLVKFPYTCTSGIELEYAGPPPRDHVRSSILRKLQVVFAVSI